MTYKADNRKDANIYTWKPSIFMPKEAARIFLEVTGVRAERLQDITLEDIKAEGISDPEQLNFPTLWNSTIKPKARAKHSWKANPWVWVYEFEADNKILTEEGSL
ncbi:hypothetical protein FACS189490_12160 [Clostridia bacterium]|nr:hypothetical protein FACS189490_12160 [Clostridia bacterium]